ncbi:twin-arginine translocase TatA/TatE family subunit [Frigoribacterium faeni]|uniref:Sec-independent protein translocase protein TatA n=1 Tax=Frigoribacterium faeni TaxID=145483 RepID=A0A7W3JFH6_9MICO|nr:twin-arginine translocase TatA/TatE family subunit [Frigoribacterium faeni]MBA8811882.1 sec-independent protein translocase protein TatA [Frigoribacterium faeni]GEK84582.1 hypothetical protein FFA01_28910 [Frigoribacterium faeni]
MGLLQNLTGWHAVIILAVILLLFGAAKLPALARSVGQSMRIVKAEMKEAPGDGQDATASRGAASTPTGSPAAVAHDDPR